MNSTQTNPETRVSLLIRLRGENNDQDWAQFVSLYAPVIFQYARRQGLQDADAADMVQDVLRSVTRSIKDFAYDPSQGRFRSWLRAVCRTRLVDFYRKQERILHGTGRTSVIEQLEQLASPPGKDEIDAWEQEYRKSALQLAIEQVQPSVQPTTWNAFRLTSIDGIPSDQVARDLDLSVGAVYTARSRVLAKLKKAIDQISED